MFANSPCESLFGADLRNEYLRTAVVVLLGILLHKEGLDTLSGGVPFCLVAFLVTVDRWTGRSMAHCNAFSRAIANTLFHGGQPHSEPTWEVFGVDTTGPVGTGQSNSTEFGKFGIQPERDVLAFRRPESTVLLVVVRHQTKAMIAPAAARGSRPQGTNGGHSACWGNHGRGGPAGCRLEPDVKVTVGGERPPRLGGDVVAFEDMLTIFVACSGVRVADAYHKPRWRGPVAGGSS